MAALASDWLRHFRLLLWNRWIDFKETWQEARSQHPLPSLCFSGRSEKQDGRPGLWLAETFSTSPLKPLNGIQRNLTGGQDHNFLYKVWVFRADQLTKMSALVYFSKRWHIVLRCMICGPLGLLLGLSHTQDGRPGLWLAETFGLLWIKITMSSTKFVFFRAISKQKRLP